jgi:hypothetical protein
VEIAKEIQKAVRAQRAKTVSQKAYDDFTCVFDNEGRYLLTSGTKGSTSSVVVTGLDTRVRLPAGTHRFVILINGDGPHEVKIQGALDDGAAIAGAIESAVQSINPKRAVNKDAFEKFECTYKNSGDEANDDANPSLLLKSGEKGLAFSKVVNLLPASGDTPAPYTSRNSRVDLAPQRFRRYQSAGTSRPRRACFWGT